MNSEPSGTDADIPDSESAIDVFILCKDARDSQQVSDQTDAAGIPGYPFFRQDGPA